MMTTRPFGEPDPARLALRKHQIRQQQVEVCRRADRRLYFGWVAMDLDFISRLLKRFGDLRASRDTPMAATKPTRPSQIAARGAQSQGGLYRILSGHDRRQ
jgi:hypothetical protein